MEPCVSACGNSRSALTVLCATTETSDNRLLVSDSSAQLHQATLSTQPGRWNRKRDEREGIPVGAEVGNAVPSYNCAYSIRGKTQRTENQGMQHGPSGRESSCNVRGHDTINRAIGRRQQEDRLAKRGDYPRGSQQRVRADGENDAHESACDDGANAS
jgi:hypothetical protein